MAGNGIKENYWGCMQQVVDQGSASLQEKRKNKV
jgi:hypothetical protein